VNAALALALATMGLAWAYFTRRPAADVRAVKLSILPPEKTSFAGIAVSPNGRWLAFTAATGGKVQLWVRALDATESKALGGTEGATLPFWSPDSRAIGFFASGKLKKIDAAGGVVSTLCDVGVSNGGTWSRDGVILFSRLGGVGISRVSASGGDVATVMRVDSRRQETDYANPFFLPDGRHFLYNVFSGQKEIRGVYVGSLDGSLRRRLVSDHTNAVYAAAGRSEGFLLFGRDGALVAHAFDAGTLQLKGEAFPIAPHVGASFDTTAGGAGRRLVTASDNGVLVFDPFPNRQSSHLVWVDRGGRPAGALDRMESVSMVRLSPDGRRYAVSRLDSESGNGDLWVSDVTGGNATRLTFDPGNDTFPVWSPDGGRLAWASNREGTYRLYQKAASGSGQDALLLKADLYVFPTDWSRDGRVILYRQIDPKTKYDIWALPVGPRAGDEKPFAFLQTEANEAAAVFSPDGRWVAYASDESGQYEVYVQAFPAGGGKRQVSAGGGIAPQWRSDGSELFYHALDGTLMAATVEPGASFAARPPTPLFEFRPSGPLITPYYAVTPDGRRFLLSTIVDTVAGAPFTVVLNWTEELKQVLARGGSGEVRP
jgi:Tol biopolymer transport system component